MRNYFIFVEPIPNQDGWNTKEAAIEAAKRLQIVIRERDGCHPSGSMKTKIVHTLGVIDHD